jgi:hypothetical protein
MLKLIITAALIASTMSSASATDEEWMYVGTTETNPPSYTYRTYVKPSSVWHGPHWSRMEVRDVHVRHPKYDYVWAKWDVNCNKAEMRRIPGLRHMKDGTSERRPVLDWFTPSPTGVRRDMFAYICGLRAVAL